MGTACTHPVGLRVDGKYDGSVIPRFPLIYGSAQVERCDGCGSWRLPVHDPAKWLPGPYEAALAQSVKEMEDL